MRNLPVLLILCAGLAACATPENRRELYSPTYPYQPIPYTAPTQPGEPMPSPTNTTVWYGPHTRNLITGAWQQGPMPSPAQLDAQMAMQESPYLVTPPPSTAPVSAAPQRTVRRISTGRTL